MNAGWRTPPFKKEDVQAMMGESVARAACRCEDVKSGHAGALHGLGRGGGRRPPGSHLLVQRAGEVAGAKKPRSSD